MPRACARTRSPAPIQYYDAPGRRRPAHDDAWSAPRRRYGALVRQPHPGDRLPARGRAGHRRAGHATSRPAQRVRRPRQAGHQRHRRLDRRHPGDGRRAAGSSTSARPRASTSSCRATGSSPRTGLILRTEKSVLFVIPWGRHWIIGTTDTDWDARQGPPGGQPQPTSTTCSTTSTRCCATPLTRDDVEGVYAGLRPLLAGESESTSKLSREHVVGHPVPGPGRGRRRQVHDLPGDGQGRRRRGGARPWTRRVPDSCTDDVPLLGADGYRGAVEPAAAARRRRRAARRPDRAPAQPLRRR